MKKEHCSNCIPGLWRRCWGALFRGWAHIFSKFNIHQQNKKERTLFKLHTKYLGRGWGRYFEAGRTFSVDLLFINKTKKKEHCSNCIPTICRRGGGGALIRGWAHIFSKLFSMNKAKKKEHCSNFIPSIYDSLRKGGQWGYASLGAYRFLWPCGRALIGGRQLFEVGHNTVVLVSLRTTLKVD